MSLNNTQDLKWELDYHYRASPDTCLINVAFRELSKHITYHPVTISAGIKVLLADYDGREWTVDKAYTGKVTITHPATRTSDVTVTIKLYDGEFPYDSLICDWEDVTFTPRTFNREQRNNK